jgi:hypothetical protein
MGSLDWGIKYTPPDTHLNLGKEETVYVGPYPGGHFNVITTGDLRVWQVTPNTLQRTHVEPFVITRNSPFQFFNIDPQFKFEVYSKYKDTDVMVVRVSDLGVNRDEVD